MCISNFVPELHERIVVVLLGILLRGRVPITHTGNNWFVIINAYSVKCSMKWATRAETNSKCSLSVIINMKEINTVVISPYNSFNKYLTCLYVYTGLISF